MKNLKHFVWPKYQVVLKKFSTYSPQIKATTSQKFSYGDIKEYRDSWFPSASRMQYVQCKWYSANIFLYGDIKEYRDSWFPSASRMQYVQCKWYSANIFLRPTRNIVAGQFVS